MLYLSQVDRPARARPARRADRQGRRPDRRHRRPLSARDRPRRRDRPARGSSCPGRRSRRSTPAGRRCAHRRIDITQVPPAAQRDPAAAPTCMDKQIVDIDGRKVVRVNDLRLDEVEGALHLVAVDVGRGRPAAPARHRRAVPHDRPQPAAAACPSATSTGRTSTRSRRSIAAIKLRVPARGPAPSCTRPTWPRSSTSSRRATGPASWPPWTTRPSADAIEEMEPETQVDVLEDLEPGARRRHPRGDEPGRRRRPRRRPVRGQPATRSWPSWSRTRPRRSRSCWATPRTRPAAS